MRSLASVFGGLLVGSLLISTGAQAEVTVKAIDTGWKVEAKEEPLTGILRAIAKHAAIKISGTAKLVEDPAMSGVYEGSIETILPKLLRQSDYVFQTTKDANGVSRVSKLVLLSGVKGRAPSARAINAARKLPDNRPSAMPLTAQEQQQGSRVTALLTQQARVSAGIESDAGQANADDQSDTPNSSGITRNSDGSFSISPEAQARLAQASAQANQDLQALVSSIRRNESDGN